MPAGARPCRRRSEADGGQPLSGQPAGELDHARLQVGVEACGIHAGEDGGDPGLVADRGGAALLGEQVDRERRDAGGGKAARDLADVVDQAAVLMDDEDATHRVGRRRPGAHQRAVRPGERDRLRGDRRPPLDRPPAGERVAAPVRVGGVGGWRG
jgi:hypothetical protein